MAKKITQYPPSGGNPDVGSLIDISELISGVYTSKKLTIQQLLDYLTANLSIGATTSLFNNTGSTITKGTPVQIGSGVNGLIPNLKVCSTSDATNDGKIFIPDSTILNGASGNCIESGLIQFGSTFATGDKVFWNVATSTFSNVSTLDDQIFIGIIIFGSPLSSGKMFVAPRFSPSLVKGTSGQIPLFLGERKINGNTHFTFIDNAGTEVGFRFSDNSNNLTQVGVTYINIESEGIASNSVLRLANWSDNTNKGIVSFRKSRGSKATPTKVLTNDVLGTMIFAGASEKNIDGSPAPMSGMTTGEIIVRALNNFIKNYDSFGDETFAQGLTQFEVWMQGSNAYSSGDFTPLNSKVFSVDGDGTLRLKNNKLVFLLDFLQNVNLSIGDSNDKITFDELTGQFTLLSNTQNPSMVVQSGTSGFYPRIVLGKGETGGDFPFINSILGVISSNNNDIIKFVATENHTLSDRGTDVILNTLLNGGGSYVKEVLRLCAIDGKLKVSNAYKLPNVAGTNGQVLVTDGAGNVSWGTPSGVNIFNSNGTLTSNRTVTLANLNLILSGIGINGSTYLSRSNGAPNPTISVINLLYNSLQLSNTDGYSASSILLQSNQITNTVYDNDSNSTRIEQTAGQIKLFVDDVVNITNNQFIITANGFLFNSYTLPKTDGASGTSLITDGVGNVAWGTPSMGSATSMQTIGRNSTGSILRKGTVVSISGSTGNRPNFVKAQANAESTSAGTFGIVVSDIANNSDGYVVTIGTVSGLDTRAVATNPFTTDTLVDGDTIYLSPTIAGYITNVKPSAPNHLVYIGKVIQTSPTNGTIVYRIQNGYELDEIHDVAISGLANDDVLQYESATQLWKNKPLSTTSEDIWKANPNETYRGISINNNSTTVISDGGVVMSTSASTLAQSVGSSYFALKQIRLRYYASVVSGGRYTGTRGSALLWFLNGGFRYVCDFNISDTAFSAGCQQFYGLANSTADLNYGTVSGTLVNTLLNVIGIGSENGDANLQVFHNDASGICTKIDLGAGFPANRTSLLASTTVYQIQILNIPGTSVVQYKVINKETGAVASGTISTNLPDPTTGLNFFASRCMAVTSVTNSGQFDLMKLGVYSML